MLYIVNINRGLCKNRGRINLLLVRMLIDGVNIRQIQNLLGHKHLETTMVYTHVARDMSNLPQSPLDSLYAKELP